LARLWILVMVVPPLLLVRNTQRMAREAPTLRVERLLSCLC